MKINNLGSLDLRKNYDRKSLDSVIARIHSGNTILFIGAGFSLGSLNKSGTSLPLAKELSKEICQLGGFDVDEDLAYAADYYVKYYDHGKLLKLLEDTFTIIEVASYHKQVADVDWRRVYTTNYDNCFELASSKIGKRKIPITLEHSPAQYFRKRNVCVHINGSIELLDKNSLENSFKLTESSYTNSDAFFDSSWSYRFRKDLEVCSQIVFVGYSLYDMEVRRLLVDNENIKKKVSFITREDVSTKEHHRLSAFGEVFPIGVEQFGKLLAENKPKVLPQAIEYLASLQKEEAKYDIEYTDTDIRDFLLRGKIDRNFILSSLTSDKQTYAIKREVVEKIIEILQSKTIVVIHSSLANGKTVLAQQIVSHLLIDGKLVYSVDDEDADYEKDIEVLAELHKRVYLFIDDFEKNIDIVKYFAECLGDNAKLILTERSHRYRRAIQELGRHGLNVSNINIDYLFDSEVRKLAAVLTNTGLWGELGALSYEGQFQYLKQECEAQISVVLMQLLKAPHILELFSNAFSGVVKYPDTNKTVYAICLIQHIYPTACKRSLISNITESDHVFSREFEDRIAESGLFEFHGDRLSTRSSIFGTFLLNTIYKASYSIEQMIRILKKLERNYASLSFEEKELDRSLMTFATLSAILPEKNKASSYIQYYEKLKLEVPTVIGNPHYWLQYSMALMSENKLSDAERILGMAYSKVKNREGYDTSYIDNQFARLNLKKALVEEKISLSFEYFMRAHKILRQDDDDVYKFRQAGLYIPYYQKRYVDLPKGDKVEFEHAIKEISRHFKRYLENEYPLGNPPSYQNDTLNEFENVIQEIYETRNN